MRQTLTEKQRQSYQALRKFIEEHGVAPTLKEFRELLGVSSTRTAVQYLEALEKKGLIKRRRYSKRGIFLSDQKTSADMVLLPVVGSVGCDNLNVFADPTWDEYLSVSSDLISNTRRERTIVVKATGASMEEAGIKDGDYILTELNGTVRSGDLVVAIVDGMAVAKKIEILNNAVILHPVSKNPEYKSIILKQDPEKLGRIVDIIRSSNSKEVEIIPIKEDSFLYEPKNT